MKTVTKKELVAEILREPQPETSAAPSADVDGSAGTIQSQAEWAARVLDRTFGAILGHLREGRKVELDDFLALSVTKARNAELREDECDRYHAYAPVSGQLKAVPIGHFARSLHLGQIATLYFLTDRRDRFAEVLTHHFHKRGWNVVVESDPGRILARIDREVPYSILADSSVAGWQDLVRGIKCHVETNGVPILVIHAADGDGAQSGGLMVQHDETVAEPFDILDLLEKMEDRLATRVATLEEEMLTLSMVLPGDTVYRRHACSLVTETLTRALIAPEFARSAAMALNEILTNAVEHGNGGDLIKTVSLRVLLDPRRLLVTVRDQGAGFNHTKVMSEARARKNDPGAQTGLSRVLRAVDRVEYNKSGNEVVLTKFRR
ncbi:MAG: ATP-binding protein [Planctomycetes bacterium]|nr:ATP-binding protein [Planctomycetota bacterium]